jgi:hypothetical protein
MRRAALVAHLSVPAALTIAVSGLALGREQLSAEMMATYVLGGYFFYAAPHLVWAAIATATKASRVAWHAGFIAASLALAAIAGFWIGNQDSSGLPLQWALYWPLAAFLQLFALSGAAVYRGCRPRSEPSGVVRR